MVPKTRNELLVDDYFSQFQKNLLNKSQNNTSSALFVSICTVMHLATSRMFLGTMIDGCVLRTANMLCTSTIGASAPP